MGVDEQFESLAHKNKKATPEVAFLIIPKPVSGFFYPDGAL